VERKRVVTHGVIVTIAIFHFLGLQGNQADWIAQNVIAIHLINTVQDI